MRRRRWAFSRTIAFAKVVTLSCMCVRAARADELKVRGEIGAEYDDNVHWTTQDEATTGTPKTGSPLARLVLGLAAADRVGDRQDVAFSLLGASKTFAASGAKSENVGVVETSGTWRLAIGDNTRLGVNGSYFEAIQAGTAAERQVSGVARDFRSLSPTWRMSYALGAIGTLGFGAGYRWFVYKPLRTYDFQAPVMALEYRLTRETSDGGADWEVLATTGVEFREFAGMRLVPSTDCTAAPCTTIVDPNMATHRDQFFSGRLDITRTGRILVGAGYAIQWNRSNSYSEALFRHAGTVRLTTRLPLGLYLAARAELVYLLYPDKAAFPPGPSGQSRTTIEDENRSHLRAELSRDISNHLQLVARYSLYVNALRQNPYERQTITLSLSITID